MYTHYRWSHIQRPNSWQLGIYYIQNRLQLFESRLNIWRKRVHYPFGGRERVQYPIGEKEGGSPIPHWREGGRESITPLEGGR